jgi:ABC-type dipeptide/oligopeptide/nickel transport system permease subunit
MGAPTRWILARHLLPNLVGPIIVYATLAVPQAILQESFLSFLGIGVRPPLPSWGRLASDGLSELTTLAINPAASSWWLLLFPCLLLGLTLFGLNLMGDALRDRLDPRQARVRRPR